MHDCTRAGHCQAAQGPPETRNMIPSRNVENPAWLETVEVRRGMGVEAGPDADAEFIVVFQIQYILQAHPEAQQSLALVLSRDDTQRLWEAAEAAHNVFDDAGLGSNG